VRIRKRKRGKDDRGSKMFLVGRKGEGKDAIHRRFSRKLGKRDFCGVGGKRWYGRMIGPSNRFRGGGASWHARKRI